MQHSRRGGAGLVAIIGCALLLAGCNLSKTGAVPPGAPDIVSVFPTITGGTTQLTLDQSTIGTLSGMGITIKPTGSATAQGGVVDFPITSGYAEVHRDHAVRPGWIQGSLDHAGSGIDITDFGKTVSASDFVVDPGNSMLYATVNGTVGVPLLFLDGTQVTDSITSGGDVVLQGTVAKLLPSAASALETAFGLPAGSIPGGAPLGGVQVDMTANVPLPAGASTYADAGYADASYNASADHVTAISRLTGTSTTLTLEPGVVSALSSAGLKLSGTGSATLSGTSATFPITAGMVAIHSDKGFQPGYVVGTIDHQGSGLTITGPGGAAVSLHDFVVNPGTSVLTGTVGNGKPGTPLLFLDGSKLQVTPTGNGATLTGTVADLTDEAAKALDTTFDVTAFAPGMALGTVKVVATGS